VSSFILKFEFKVKYCSNKIGDGRLSWYVARMECKKFKMILVKEYERRRELWMSRRR